MATKNTKKTRITSTHFKRYITSQPFFVWHTLEDLNNKFNHIGHDNLFDLSFEDDEEPIEEGLGFIDEIELNSDINNKITIL
ncbi:MAG: hypothetical protein E7Y34_00095, partial [Mycoplasma sp.]|nr:hypothetical protein [Mycoplasma sp.]